METHSRSLYIAADMLQSFCVNLAYFHRNQLFHTGAILQRLPPTAHPERDCSNYSRTHGIELFHSRTIHRALFRYSLSASITPNHWTQYLRALRNCGETRKRIIERRKWNKEAETKTNRWSICLRKLQTNGPTRSITSEEQMQALVRCRGCSLTTMVEITIWRMTSFRHSWRYLTDEITLLNHQLGKASPPFSTYLKEDHHSHVHHHLMFTAISRNPFKWHDHHGKYMEMQSPVILATD